MCHKVTSSSCGNNLAQHTSHSLCNSKTGELHQQWTLDPLELPLCEATSCKTNPSQQQALKVFQSLMPRINQSPSSSACPTVNQAMGIVRPICKNTPRHKGGCDNCPSMAAITSEINTSTNLAPAPTCVVAKASDIIKQQQCANSVTSSVLGAACPLTLVNKAVAPNSALSSCPIPLQVVNTLQQSPQYSFQLPKVYEETVLPNYAQKPYLSSTAAPYSTFTEPPNLHLCRPQYYIQNPPSTVVADVDHVNITPVPSLPIPCLPSYTQEPRVVFTVGSNNPTETEIAHNGYKVDRSVEDCFSAIVLPEENYGNIAIVNRMNSDNVNAMDETAIVLDAKSCAANSQWPFNLVLNVPPVNVPAPSVTFLPTPSVSCFPLLPLEPAPVVPQCVPAPMMPIIIKRSKSKLKSLLPIILLSLLSDEGSCGAGCSCKCCSRPIPVPYPIPIPINCPIINNGSEGKRKCKNSKSKDNED